MFKNEAIYDGYCEECYTITRNEVSTEYLKKMSEQARLIEIVKAVEWAFELFKVDVYAYHSMGRAFQASTLDELLEAYRQS